MSFGEFFARVWLSIIVGVLLVAALLGVGYVVHHHGYKQGYTDGLKDGLGDYAELRHTINRQWNAGFDCAAQIYQKELDAEKAKHKCGCQEGCPNCSCDPQKCKCDEGRPCPHCKDKTDATK